LATSAIGHLEQSWPECLVFYFFFRSESLRIQSLDAAKRALLAQVLAKGRDDMETLNKIAFAPQRSKSGQKMYTESVVSDLLRLCLPIETVIVLDGLDECNSSSEVLRYIQDILAVRPRTQFLLLS
jgi:hypothetical protein